MRLGFRAMQKKPDDRFCVPLNAWCHRGPGQQHSGEAEFWRLKGLDPFAIAERLYAEFGGDGGQPKVKRKKAKKRPPPEKRQKIRSRGFQKAKR